MNLPRRRSMTPEWLTSIKVEREDVTQQITVNADRLKILMQSNVSRLEQLTRSIHRYADRMEKQRA